MNKNQSYLSRESLLNCYNTECLLSFVINKPPTHHNSSHHFIRSFYLFFQSMKNRVFNPTPKKRHKIAKLIKSYKESP
jgi:hypothetical protein